MSDSDSEIAGTMPSRGFVYVSRRLSRQAIDEYMATASEGPPRITSANIEALGLGIEFGQPSEDLDNCVQLAHLATSAVAHRTGTLESLDEFVHLKLNFHACTFNLYSGWNNATNREVGGFCASEWVDGVGRVFVGLFGSMHNFIGYEPDELAVKGWAPSDAYGLYRILDDAVEAEDLRIAPDTLEHDRKWQDEYRCHSAATIFFGMNLPPAEPLELLAQIYLPCRNINLDPPRLPGQPAFPPYDLALIGAPIWVAAPDRFARFRLQVASPPDAPPAESERRMRGRWSLRGRSRPDM